MAKYLFLWELDTTKVPVNPKERGAAWSALMEVVNQDIKKGLIKDWGIFVGEGNGYSIMEGSEIEIMKSLQPAVPFVLFKAHPIASVSQAEEVIKALTK